MRLTNAIKNKETTGALIGILLLGIFILGTSLGILWYYTTNSYMKMAGDEEVTIGLNGYFDDPGVEARISGKNVTDRVKVESDLDETTPGTYEITYSAGNFQALRTVRVLDHMSPRLELSGGDVHLDLGEEYVEPGYSASDDEGNDLTYRVKVSEIDDKRAGISTINYTVTDKKGRSTRLSRRLSVSPNTEWGSTGIPICMFHYVYDENDPPDDLNRRYGNYISLQALQEEVDWLKSEDYYFPTWREVREYVDGKLILPAKSIVLTFDDGEKATLKQLVPFVEKNKVPVTSFLITSKKGDEKVVEYASRYLIFQSHTHDLHRPGGVRGYKGIFPVIGIEEGVADLNISAQICGSRDAFAYPYGTYSESARAILEEADFMCAVTTQPGKVYPGDDPLRLQRQRMMMGQSLETFQSKVAPPETETDQTTNLR